MFTGPPAYQSFGRSRISRRSPITPNIRIGPTFCELMKMANSVAAAMKMAAGSLIGGELWGRGVISSGIEVVDQPEPLQHQPLVHELDDRCLGRDQAGEPTGGDHARVLAQLLFDAGHHAFDLRRETEDDASLHPLGGGRADYVGGRLELNALQPSRPLVERVDRDSHPWRDGTAEVIALFRDHVVGRGGPEIDDDQRTAVFFE